MADSGIIIEAKNISKDFGAVKALYDVSFSLEKGKILGLVGDNGAGKSTLLKILSGALLPTNGEIYFEGEKVFFKSTADAMKKGIAIAYQFLELVDIAKVWQNFFIGRELKKGAGFFSFLDIEGMKLLTKEAMSKHNQILDVDEEVKNLPGEQRQVLAVARALEANPKILLLDESFTLLSLEGRKEIINFLKTVNENIGTTMIIVSHDLDLIKKLCHCIMVLKSGVKMFIGSNHEISIDEIVRYMLP